MSKGIYRGQSDQSREEVWSKPVFQHGSQTTPTISKGIYQGQHELLNHKVVSVLASAPEPNQEPSLWNEREDAVEQGNSAFPTRNATRSPSPSNSGRIAPGQDIPVSAGQTVKIVLENSAAPSASAEKSKPHPQESMTNFWSNFDPDYLGKITNILPDNLVKSTPATSKSTGETAHHAVTSYEQIRDKCIRDVKRIIRECRSLNKKYTDTHFDIERDLKITRQRDCLDGLVMSDLDKTYPSDVKRVCDIFEKPTFYSDRANYDDIVQGNLGDCWLLAALSVLTCNEELVRKVCVIQDQDVGVYGFVFNRDGEWHQTIIDDKLYLLAPSYDESGDVVLGMYGVTQRDQERSYNDMFQKGSKSLYFAQCRNENETWVPLLEKAYGKAHGSFHTMVGGQTGEALEDLTGGVTTEIYTTNILNRDEFWFNELRKNGKDFIFSAAAASYREWRPSVNSAVREERRQGIVSSHAYAILDTYEGHGQRLVKMRNPWGSTEWNGAWSDGSKEWNSGWFERLNHKFGDDGVFWISYEDMLRKYKYLDRTRLFGPEWHLAQQWVSVQVPWNTMDYQSASFCIDVPAETEAVLVLSQLDDRYFQGLQGKYNYVLQFRVQKDGEDEEEYIARSPSNYELVRSSNVEVSLDKGSYTVLFKVEAHKTSRRSVEKVIKSNVWRREKLMQVGKLYDLAHQKGKTSGHKPARLTQPPPSTSPEGKSSEGKKSDDRYRDPWNATCVVGLRVYSKQADLGLKVVLPKDEDETTAPTLDRDDIAKAALDEVQAQTQTGAEDKEPPPTDGTSEPDPAASIAPTDKDGHGDAAADDDDGEEEAKDGDTQHDETRSEENEDAEEVAGQKPASPTGPDSSGKEPHGGDEKPRAESDQAPRPDDAETESLDDLHPSTVSEDSVGADFISISSGTEMDDLSGDKACGRGGTCLWPKH